MKSVLLLLVIILQINVSAQEQQKVFTSDIDNFWIAYDSIQKVNSQEQKIHLINKLYIDKGTKGLKAFMKARKYNDSLWVRLINRLPKFWNSVRSNTLKVKFKANDMEKAVMVFKQLYPELKDAKMYFTIGGLRSGGTTWGNMVLVGTEIAAADSFVDVSEFKNKWLPSVFKKQNIDHVLFLNIHEYVHTQQKRGSKNVLAASIREGACDFIAELVTKQSLKSQYLFYGNAHEKEVKELFKKEMLTKQYSNWLSNGGKMGEKADLGYYIGYKICKSYYEISKNKSKAIKDIMELDYSNNKEVLTFLKKAKYISLKK